MEIKVIDAVLSDRDHAYIATVNLKDGTFNVPFCNYCKSPGDPIVQISHNNTIYSEISFCKSCGSVWKSIRPRSINLNEHFKKSWLHQKQKLFDIKDSPFDVLHKKIKKGGAIFDFGCGNGDRLLKFANFGFDVRGCEPNVERAYVAKSLGLDIQCDFGANVLLNLKNKFDLIYFYNVLQFCEKPDEILSLSKMRLSDNGLIYIKTGRYYKEANPLFYAFQNVMLNGDSLHAISKFMHGLNIYPNFVRYSMNWCIFSTEKNHYTKFIDFTLPNDGLRLKNMIIKFHRNLPLGNSTINANNERKFLVSKINNDGDILKINVTCAPFVLMK